MSTKGEFVLAYAKELRETYEWAADEEKLKRYMNAVIITLTTSNHLWTIPAIGGGPLQRAWEALGKKGRPTLLDLKTLPEGELRRV